MEEPIRIASFKSLSNYHPISEAFYDILFKITPPFLYIPLLPPCNLEVFLPSQPLICSTLFFLYSTCHNLIFQVFYVFIFLLSAPTILIHSDSITYDVLGI